MSSSRLVVLSVIQILVLSLPCVQVTYAERVMVCVDDASGASPQDMMVYGIKVKGFGAKTGFDGFPEAISGAGILFVPGGENKGIEKLVAAEANRKAIRNFLSRGGIIWIGYYTWDGKEIRAFLKSLGVGIPDISTGGHRYWVPNPKSTSRFLTTPTRQTDEGGHTRRLMTSWPDGLEPLLIEKRSPDEAGLLMAKNVLGKGTIFFSATSNEWTTKRRGLLVLIENIMVAAYGPLPAPGETFAVADACEPRIPGANTTHLLHAEQAEWHVGDATVRKVFLVSEPVGLRRRSAYVEAAWRLGKFAHGSTVRAFTRNGVELHVQRMEGDRLALSVPLRAYDDNLIYVYAGGSSPPAVWDRTAFESRKSEDGWLLRNDYFDAGLAPRLPRLWELRPHGDTKNTLMSWGGSERWFGNGTHFDMAAPYSENKAKHRAVSKSELVADGPVIKTVRYTVRDWAGHRVIDISLVRGSRALFFEGRAQVPHSISTEIGWCPGDAFGNDELWYEAKKGMKRLGLIIKPASQYDLSEIATEGWYAVADAATGEAGGGFSEPYDEITLPLTFRSHAFHGQLIKQTFAFTPEGTRGGWVATMEGAAGVRAAYVRWRNPPTVMEGPEQARKDMGELPVPVFGKDFLRIHGGFRRFFPSNESVGLDDWGESAVAAVREAAGNVVAMGDHLVPDHFPALLTAARARGMAVCLKVNTRRLGCSVTNREAYLQATRKMAPYKADLYYLLDEFVHNYYNQVCAADFQQKTGLVMPEQLDLADLPDAPTYQTILWRMNVVTELNRLMADIVKKERPDAVTFSVSNTGGMGWEFPSYNDLEKFGQILGTTSSDLYPNRYELTRFGIQLIRGAQGNDRPVLTVHGNNLTSATDNYNNLGQHLMSGANALWFFAIVYHRFGRDVMEPVIREYEVLRNTGLGDVLAGARSVRYAAVLFERASFFDCVRRGDFIGLRPVYHARAQMQSSLRNVPTNIVFTSHLEKELPGYRVLIVPGGRAMSDETVKTIGTWVRGGGRVIIQGDALLTPALADLCGVSVTSKPGDALTIVATGAQVLTGVGKAVVTKQTVGKGTVVAVAGNNVPHDLLRPLVIDVAGVAPPVSVDAAASADVHVSALTDGVRTAIGVYNEAAEPKTVTVTLGSLAPLTNRIVTNVHRGIRAEVADSVTVDLPGNAWHFLILESADSARRLPTPGNTSPGRVYAH